MVRKSADPVVSGGACQRSPDGVWLFRMHRPLHGSPSGFKYIGNFTHSLRCADQKKTQITPHEGIFKVTPQLRSIWFPSLLAPTYVYKLTFQGM